MIKSKIAIVKSIEKKIAVIKKDIISVKAKLVGANIVIKNLL